MSLFNLLSPNKTPSQSITISPAEQLKIKVGNLNQLPMIPEEANKALAIANDPN